MTSVGGHQFLILMWKNLILRQRHYILTSLELFFPVVLSAILIILYFEGPEAGNNAFPVHNATYYEPVQLLNYYSNCVEEPANGTSTTFFYTPDTSLTSKLINETVNLYQSSLCRNVYVEAVSSEDAIVQAAEKHWLNRRGIPFVGIVFPSIRITDVHLPNWLDYRLRYISDHYNFRTRRLYLYREDNGPRDSNDDAYEESGFYFVQAAIDHTFIRMKQKEKNLEKGTFQVSLRRFPYPSYTHREIRYRPTDGISQVLVFGLTIVFSVAVKRIVEEKANNAKKLMGIMGLSNAVYWVANFASNFVFLVLINIILSLLYKARFRDHLACVPSTSGLLLFATFLLFDLSSLLFWFALSVFFKKPTVSVTVITFFWLSSDILMLATIFATSHDENLATLPLGYKLLLCLIPTGAIQMVSRIIAVHEDYGAGVQWSTMTSSFHYGINLAMVLTMMLLSCVISGVVIWYVESERPSRKRGSSTLHLPSACTTSCKGRSKISDVSELDVIRSSHYFEDDPISQIPTIILSHITQRFRTSVQEIRAIDGLSLNIYHGQITALLGHTEAGKTTIINIITGLVEPSYGSVLVNGYNVHIETDLVRRCLGVCPQFDVCYKDLTVKEQLTFLSGLKGVHWTKLRQEVNKILLALQLEGVAKSFTKELSEEELRKLSIATAISGDSEIFLLDDPTHSLDPISRGQIWSLLQSMRYEKTILLATSSIEEATALADRIAIMSAGVIHCWGSPLFLQKKFDTGYRVTFSKSSCCSVPKVTQLLQQYEPKAKLENITNDVVTYSLNNPSSENLTAMFQKLEEKKKEMGLLACNLNVTTLEDVFLRLHVEDTILTEMDKEMKKVQYPIPFLGQRHAKPQGEPLSPEAKLDETNLLVQQMKALLMKRVSQTRRSRNLIFPMFLFPWLMITVMQWIACSLTISHSPSVREKPLKLQMNSFFGHTRAIYKCESYKGLSSSSESSNSLTKFCKEPLRLSGISPATEKNIESFILDLAEKNFIAYWQDYFIAVNVTTTANASVYAEAWYNGELLHIGAISLNLINRALLFHAMNSTDATFGIGVTNFPITTLTAQKDIRMPRHIKAVYAMFLSATLSSIVGCVVLLPIQERITKFKLLQTAAGLSVVTYWAANYIADFLLHFITSLLLLVPFTIFDSLHLFGGEATGTLLLLLLVYGWCCIPLGYLFAFTARGHSSGFRTFIAFNLITGAAANIILLPFDSSRYEFQVIVWLLRFLPNFALCRGFVHLAEISLTNGACNLISQKDFNIVCPFLKPENFYRRCCPDICSNQCFQRKSPIGWGVKNCGWDIVIMFIAGFFYFFLLIALELRFARRWIHRTAIPDSDDENEARIPIEDEVVVEERTKIVQDLLTGNDLQNHSLIAVNLTAGGPKHSVHRVTFRVKGGECFGIVGIKGSGKTSLLRLLTGDLHLADGDAFISRYSLQKNPVKFRSFLGYCPPVSSFGYRLNVREMLHFFARLRGLREENIREATDKLLRTLDIIDQADFYIDCYSKDAQRRVSVALALIGHPPVVFLDEPTLGMDEQSKRKIWNVLLMMKEATQMSFLLATRSMEECEALCDRMAILVGGRIHSLGTVRQLKDRFGHGYIVTATLRWEYADGGNSLQLAGNFIEKAFGGAVLLDRHQSMLCYHITNTSLAWVHILSVMDKAKQAFQLEQYFVSVSTLEQIMLILSRALRFSSGPLCKANGK